MNKKKQMSKHKLDLLEFYIASRCNMKKLNSKENKEIEDKIHIEKLRKYFGLSIKKKKEQRTWNN